MAIVIDNLNLKEPGGWVYSDVHLDLQPGKHMRGGVYDHRSTDSNDIKVAFDEAAISNSLNNLFASDQGDWVLAPTYGINLHKFLFDPVSQTRGKAIGDLIVRQIERWEPRVEVENVLVVSDEDTQMYEIAIVVKIPVLDNQYVMRGKMGRDHGVNFIPIQKRA